MPAALIVGPSVRGNPAMGKRRRSRREPPEPVVKEEPESDPDVTVHLEELLRELDEPDRRLQESDCSTSPGREQDRLVESDTPHGLREQDRLVESDRHGLQSDNHCHGLQSTTPRLRRPRKKVDKVEKRAARQESKKLLKRLGKKSKQQNRAGMGQLETLLTCLRADPSSARVAAHRINRTLHPKPRRRKMKKESKNVKTSRPQSTRLQLTRYHVERLLS